MATKKQFIYPTIAIVIGIAGLIGLKSMKKPPPEKVVEDKIPVVAVAEVKLASMDLLVGSQGVVAARYETRLVAQVSGEIVELSELFVRGGFAKKGQLLARIDPNDYEAALIEAQANLAQAQAALELEIAQGRVAEEEWKNISSAKPSELGLRRPQLRQEQAKVKAAQAAVKRAKRNLERTRIVAPYDALIDSRNIGIGSFVSTGSELGKLMSTALADVRLPVPTSQMQYLVNGGMGATVTLAGNVGGKDVAWQAKVVRSEGVIDEKSRMTYLVAEVEEPYAQPGGAESLRFGTYVTANISGLFLPSAVSVPRHLIDDGRLPLLDDDSKLHYQAVTVVREQARSAIVTEGLNSGDRIVITALESPVEGMQLVLREDNDVDVGSEKPQSQVAMSKE